MKTFLSGLLFASLAFNAEAQVPRLDTIAFFKEAIGLWKGKGTSIAGPDKNKLEVIDDWESQFAKEGTLFIQVGTVKLSNGTGFQYRWVYQVDPKSQKLIAVYNDSKKIQDIFLVELADNQTRISVAPRDATGAPAKGGLFTTTYLKEGQLVYDAEVRDREGKPFIQTRLAAVRVKATP